MAKFCTCLLLNAAPLLYCHVLSMMCSGTTHTHTHTVVPAGLNPGSVWQKSPWLELTLPQSPSTAYFTAWHLFISHLYFLLCRYVCVCVFPCVHSSQNVFASSRCICVLMSSLMCSFRCSVCCTHVLMVVSVYWGHPTAQRVEDADKSLCLLTDRAQQAVTRT